MWLYGSYEAKSLGKPKMEEEGKKKEKNLPVPSTFYMKGIRLG